MNPTELGKTIGSSLNPIDDFVFPYVEARVTGKNGNIVTTIVRLHRVRAGENAGRTAFIEYDGDGVAQAWPMHAIRFDNGHYELVPDELLGVVGDYWKPIPVASLITRTTQKRGTHAELDAFIDDERAILAARGLPDSRITVTRGEGQASVSWE